MKRKPVIISLMMTFACASALGVATGCDGCNSDKKTNVIDSNDGYKWTYNQPFVDDMDEDMTIDGKLDEARWTQGEKKWLTHTEKNVEMRYTTAFTQKGLYIAAEAKDPGMQWNDTRQFANNSSFYFYIISDKATEYHAFDCMGFYVDELHSACRQNSRFAAKGLRTEVDGVPTLTAEFFASWEALNYTVDETTGMPEVANFLPQYRYVVGANSTENTYLKPALAETGGNRVKNAYSFNGDGYINVDVEGAELGNAVTGFAKSDGWDLSNIKGDNKSITATRVGDQAIFFKGINSSRYSYSVDVTFNESFGEGIPAVGVFDMKNAEDFNIMWFHGEDIKNGATSYRYFLRDLHTGRQDMQHGNLNVENGSRTIKIRVIKDDSKLYYIFNNKYEFSADLSWLGGKSVPGLYTFGTSATFSNWEVTDLEGADKDGAFKDLCAQYMHVINIDSTISGGSVTTDKLAVAVGGGDSVKLSIVPTRGYVLTDFTINSESTYDNVLSDMEGGVLTLTPNKALNIGATFSSMPASETLRITGNVKRSNGVALIGMSYSVHSEQSENVNILYNYGSTTSAGIFDITVLKAGTHTIGGKTITTDGKYTLTFDGIFSKGENNSIVIDTTDEKFNGQTYHDYGDVILNPVKALQMTETVDGKIQTTNTKVNQSELFSYFVTNDEVSGSFELTMTINAKNDGWPCYGITIEDANNNAMSLFAAGPKYYRIMKSYDGRNYQQYDKSTTYKDGICNIKLVYDAKKDVFKFYVNDVLFDTLKRTDYLTGTTFKYGPVGYMVGADGNTGAPITNDNPFATFTKPQIVTEYTLTLPNGATVVTSDGIAITDGKVPLLSTVTVTIPVSSNKNYMIYVDGLPVATVKEDGKISATFDVTANSNVSYEEAQEISGSISLGDKYPSLNSQQSLGGVEVLFAGENGKVVYTAITDSEGKFTASLPHGTFYVGAKGEYLVSDSVQITVSEEMSEFSLTLNKPAIDEQIYEGELGYDAKTGNYVKDGVHGQKAAGFLAGATVENGKSFIISVKMSNLGNDWPSGGFAIGNSAEKFVKFEIVRANDNTYIFRIKDEVSNGETLLWFREKDELKKYNSLTEFTFKVVHSNGNYFIFFENDLIASETNNTALGKSATIKSAIGSGKNVKLGLYGEEIITFSEWNYTFDESEIKSLIGRTLTLQDGLTATVNGETVTDGSVVLGAEVTVSVDVPAGESRGILVDGVPVATEIKDGKAIAVFTVTGNHSVTYSSTYAVSGTVTGGYEDTVIRIAAANGEALFTGKGTSFSTMLLNGTYYLTAQGKDKVSEAVEFTVQDGKVENLNVTLSRLAITEQVYEHEFLYSYVDGSFYATHTPDGSPMFGGYLSGAVVESGKGFVLTSTMKGMGESMWPSTGLLVGTSKDKFVRFDIIRNTDSNVFGLQVRTAEGKETISWFNAEPFTKWSKPFGEDGNASFKLDLVYNNGMFFVFFNNELAAQFNENDNILAGVSIASGIGNGARKLGVYAERQITYTEWGYSIEADKIDGYIGKTISAEDMDVTVNGSALTGNKVLLGDSVTVSVAVSEGQNVSIMLDGNALETTIAGGKATATFTVTGNHELTYSMNYTVSGTVTGGDAETVIRIATATGNVIFTGKGTSFNTSLPAGTYYLTAQSSDKVSSAVEFTVEDGKVENLNATLTKLVITELVYEHEFLYNYVDGSFYTTHTPNGSPMFGGYLSGATVEAGKDFVFTTTLKGMGESMWPSTGLLVGTSKDDFVRFNIIRNTDASIFGLQIRSGSGKETLSWLNAEPFTKWSKPFGEDGKGICKLELVYHNGIYFVFINDGLVSQYAETTVLGDNVTIASAIGDGARKLGVYAERQITYTGWEYSTATADLDKYISGDVSLADGITAKVNGEDLADGKVLLGDNITVSVEVAPGQGISILVDSNAVETEIKDGKAVAGFVVTGKHKVTYSTTFAVSGTTAAGATVRFANADGSIAKTVTAESDGSYSVNLPDGTYYASAETATAVSAVVTVKVEGAAISNIALTADRPIVTENIFAKNFSYNYVDGSLYAVDASDGFWYGGYFNGSTVETGKSFVLSATMKDMGGAWPSAGLIVGTSKDDFVRFNIIRNTDASIFGLQIRSGSGKETLSWLNAEPFTKWSKPFGEDGKASLALKLVYHNGLYSVYFNNELVAQFDETANILSSELSIASAIGNGNIKLGFYAERQLTYTAWSYETQNVEVPAEARVKGFDGIAAFTYNPQSGSFKSVWNNNNQRSVTDIDVKDVSEWVWSADVHVLSDWAYPSVGLALYNGDNTKDFITKIIRLTPDNTADNKDLQTCQLKIGNTDFGADANGNSTQQWVESNKIAMKEEVSMSLVHNADGYYLFIGNDLVWSTTDNIVDGWDSVRLGFFAEQEASVRNLSYSTDISGYNISNN